MMKRLIAFLIFLTFFLTFFLSCSFLTITAENITPISFDDLDITEVIPIKDKLYLKNNNALFCYDGKSLITIKNVDLAPKGHYATACLLTDEEQLYSLSIGEKIDLTLLINSQNQVENRILYSHHNPHSLYSKNWKIHGENLYCLALENGQQKIIALTLETGEVSAYPADYVLYFDITATGNILALESHINQGLTTYFLVSFAAFTRQRTELIAWESDLDLQAMVIDPYTEDVYFATRKQVLKQQEGTLIPVAAFLPGDLRDLALWNGKEIVICIENGLFLQSLENTITSQLVIYAPLANGRDYRLFAKEHPQTNLMFWEGDSSLSHSERFIRDMLTQSSAIDVYVLDDINLLKIINSKGYGADISQSSILKTNLSNMYPAFQWAHNQGGTITTYPEKLFLTSLGYNKQLFATFGFTPPTTYLSYFDFCLTWFKDYAPNYPNIELAPFEEGITDLQGLFIHYADEMLQNGLPLNYNTEAFYLILQKYFEVEQLYAINQNYFADEYLFTLYDFFISSQEKLPLPLTFFEGHKPLVTTVTDRDFHYFVINPYSTNKQGALALIEAYEQMRSPVSKALLFKSASTLLKMKALKKIF